MQSPGEFGGVAEQLVAGQIVADQRDPTLDEPTRWERLDDRSLPVEDLGDRAGERTLLDVPAPRSYRAADPDGLHRLGDSVGVGHGAGLDHCGDAVLHALDGAQSCRQFVVVGGVLGVNRHGPLEDRCTRW